MKLDKFQIFGFAAGLDGHGEAVACGDFGIGCEFENLAEAARGEDSLIGVDVFFES